MRPAFQHLSEHTQCWGTGRLATQILTLLETEGETQQTKAPYVLRQDTERHCPSWPNAV